MIKVAVVVAAVVVAAGAMTVTQTEEGALPPELKPIVPGGSWFDDMALERLRSKHRHVKELGGSTDEEDPEEMFIMARLRDPEITLIRTDSEGKEPQKKGLKTQDTREALRSFMRQHTERRGDEGSDGEAAPDSPDPSHTMSKEFMEIYKRELQKFINNFMSVMLQAEIGGVSIENRSEEKESQAVRTEANIVATP
ncbi:uncharacterized protein LOC135094856 [Scylla paramamosain]